MDGRTDGRLSLFDGLLRAPTVLISFRHQELHDIWFISLLFGFFRLIYIFYDQITFS